VTKNMKEIEELEIIDRKKDVSNTSKVEETWKQ
jgi:hypothetical protein